MKRVAALLISASLFFGVAVPALASLTPPAPDTCVDVPETAVAGLFIARGSTSGDPHPVQLPVVLDSPETCGR